VTRGTVVLIGSLSGGKSGTSSVSVSFICFCISFIVFVTTSSEFARKVKECIIFIITSSESARKVKECIIFESFLN